MIEVENLVKRYGGHLAVDHLSFTVEKGCVCGFLGPNGAGKSTTMNMMTGYLAPTEGEVRVDGHSVTQDPAGAKACIGYLPEQPPLYVDMTVREYLEFAAGLKRIPGGAGRSAGPHPGDDPDRRRVRPADPQPVQGLPPAGGAGPGADRLPTHPDPG